ncbi:AlpA family phage regulatory protein [uncultured Pseudodesulfovibrio sp.]|uniref:helix-turn-helix transcriptional regulator n=1 Tax=uncultured Pseudodesulfovibrio sp. TaxID=2035858 RepID=UPI0029C694F6|nr:AlpA family phage regulatory protein [uncultured Pseudodesulfovibrio sp.]
MPTAGFLRAKQLLQFIPVSKATLWRWVKDGQFPAPTKLAERTTAWDVASVREWMEERTKEGKAA